MPLSKLYGHLTRSLNTMERNKMLYNKKFYLDIRWWTGVVIGILFNIAMIAVIAHFVH